MKKLIVFLLAAMFLSTMFSTSSTALFQVSYSTKDSFLQRSQTMTVLYETGFEQTLDWQSGSFNGPDLWHQTSVDSWTGDYSLACFDTQYRCYHNNMDFNYVISPEFSVEGVIDMEMDFYCKFITEDNDDHWGIVLYDPGTDWYLSHVWTANESWRHLSYETYGYHSMWTGPMQPAGSYETFNIKQAYDHWYNLGFFRDGNGHQVYEFRIGFVFYESDESGVTNAEAEAHGEYWSGLFIDDVSIKQLTVNDAPETPDVLSGPSQGLTGVSYNFSAVTTDVNDDTIRYGWDWNDDDYVDEWTEYVASGTPVSISYQWSSAGSYQIKVLAEDVHHATSDFSEAKTIVITENNPPVKPSLTGPSSGKVDVSYTYSASTTDTEGDTVWYWFDWGDDTNTGWIGPFESGQTCDASHIWTNQGSFSVKVKAKDEQGAESVWSDSITVSMPKNSLFSIWLNLFFFARNIN